MNSEEKDQESPVGEKPSDERSKKATSKRDRSQRFEKGIEVQK